MSSGYYQLPTGQVAAIDGGCDFPPLSRALSEPNGLLAIGGDLSVPRLLAAYRQGIFPWFSEGDPVMWWSPNPRMVLFPPELRISRSLKKTLNRNQFDIRYNTAFRQVISHCSQAPRPGQHGIWITQSIIDAYCALHTQGYAISCECWQHDTLVGGCYGVLIGKMFYGESMFHMVSNASKVAFVHLVEHLQNSGVGMIDCQMQTALLTSFGGMEIPRGVFMQKLTALIQNPHDIIFNDIVQMTLTE